MGLLGAAELGKGIFAFQGAQEQADAAAQAQMYQRAMADWERSRMSYLSRDLTDRFSASGDEQTRLLGQAGGEAGDLLRQYLGGQSRLGDMFEAGKDFQTSPGYEFMRDQGEQGINRAASAGGRWGGTSAGKDLSRFNVGLAQQEYGNWFNRQSGLAGALDTRDMTLGQLLAQLRLGVGAGQAAVRGEQAGNIAGLQSSLSAQMATMAGANMQGAGALVPFAGGGSKALSDMMAAGNYFRVSGGGGGEGAGGMMSLFKLGAAGATGGASGAAGAAV